MAVLLYFCMFLVGTTVQSFDVYFDEENNEILTFTIIGPEVKNLPKSHEDAQAACEARGETLAVLKTESVFDYIVSQLRQRYKTGTTAKC